MLHSAAINQYATHFSGSAESDPDPVTNVLYVLEHDGYLERQRDDYRFVSGLLQDWWQARHGRHFVPIAQRSSLNGEYCDGRHHQKEQSGVSVR